MAPSSLSASQVRVNVSQVALRIVNLIGEIIPHLLTIEDDGTLLLNGDFDVGTMASFLCSCNDDTKKAHPAGDEQDDHDVLTPIPSTPEPEAPVPSSISGSKAPEVEPVGKYNQAGALSRAGKEASSKKPPKPGSKTGMETRRSNRLRPEVKKALDQSIKSLKEGDFRCSLEDEIQDIIEATIAARELRSKNPSLTTIKTVRFSRATFKDLEEMGVKPSSPAGFEPIKLDGERPAEVLGLGQYVNVKCFEDEWERQWILLCSNLFSTVSFFGNKLEPRTRCIADDFEKAFSRILKATTEDRRFPNGEGVVLLEISVNMTNLHTGTTAASNSNLVTWGATGTQLVGRFDYLSLVAKASTESEDLLLQLKEATNLSGILGIIRGATEDVDFLIGIIETKRLLAMRGNLEVHVPQVVAQSLAIIRNADREHAPWCLTDGYKWIFGVTWRLDKSGNQGYRYETATLNWLTGTEEIKCPEDLQSCSKQVLKVIIGWATALPDDLQELIMSWRETEGKKE